jgi:hypothetical protein
MDNIRTTSSHGDWRRYDLKLGESSQVFVYQGPAGEKRRSADWISTSCVGIGENPLL